jgi:hypothetical protein
MMAARAPPCEPPPPNGQSNLFFLTIGEAGHGLAVYERLAVWGLDVMQRGGARARRARQACRLETSFRSAFANGKIPVPLAPAGTALLGAGASLESGSGARAERERLTVRWSGWPYSTSKAPFPSLA